MRTITRSEVFKQYAIISAVISDFQNLNYDEDYPEYNTDLDHLTLGRNEALYHKSFIFMLPHNDINTYTEALSEKLEKLFKALNINEFVLVSVPNSNIIGDTTITEPKFVKAQKYLQQFTKNKNYNEAFIFDIKDVSRMIHAYFWLSRLDMSLPEQLFFFDSKQQFFFFICKRGNIHLTVLDKNINLSNEVIKQNGFLPDADIDQF